MSHAAMESTIVIKNTLAPITLALMASSAMAQTAPQPDALDSIIVTSTFRPAKLSQLGTAASVIDSSSIMALANPSVSDFLRLTPSLSVSSAGPIGTQTQVRIRGAEANHTQVFVDGIEANDPAASGEFGFSESLSSGISRIEILRGAQSALYGSEAIGGVISIITRSPFDQGSKLFADVSGGSFGTVQANGGGAWNDGTLGLLVSGGIHRTDGINISPVGNEKDGSQTITLMGKAEAKISETARAGFTARYVAQHSDYDDTQFSSTNVPYVVDTPNFQQKSKRFYARGFIAFGPENWQSTAYANIISTRNAQRTGTPSDDTDVDGGRFTLGARSSLLFDTGALTHSITTAIEHERESYADRSLAFGGGSRQDVSRTQTSLIGQYRLSVADRFFADASVRQDWNSGFADATTWRLSGAALIGAGFRLHASGGRGITNPTFTEQFGFFPGSFKGNPLLAPEKSIGFDAGVEWRNDWLRFDATYFNAWLKNEISTAFDFATFMASPVNETGVSKRAGAEISLEAQRGSFTLKGFYSYLQATEQRTATAVRSDEIRRPKHQGAVTLLWQDADVSVATSLSYTGKRLDDDFRSFPAVRLALPAYTLATVSGQYRLTQSLTAFARLENAFDSYYQDVFGYRTAGIAAYAGLRLRLD
jgi:vitamin B12 transporter